MWRYALITSVCTALFCGFGLASQFKVYPGAKLDEQTTRQANAMAAQAKQHGKSSIYITKDPFDKVFAFYKGIGKEINMPHSSGTTGKPKKFEKYDLWEAYFILDGAQDLSTSKCWVKVQRPFIGEKVRDVTGILVMEK